MDILFFLNEIGTLTEFNNPPIFLFRKINDENDQTISFFDIENLQINFSLRFENNHSINAEFWRENIYIQNGQKISVLKRDGQCIKEFYGQSFFSKGMIFRYLPGNDGEELTYEAFSFEQNRVLFLIQAGKWARFYSGDTSVLIFLKLKKNEHVFRIYNSLSGKIVNEIFLRQELQDYRSLGFYIKDFFEIRSFFVLQISSGWILGISQKSGKIIWKSKLGDSIEIKVIDEAIFVINDDRCYQIDYTSGVEIKEGISIAFPKKSIESYGRSMVSRLYYSDETLLIGRMSEDHSAILLYSNNYYKKYSPVFVKEIEGDRNIALNGFNNFHFYDDKLLVSCFNNHLIILDVEPVKN